MTKDNNIFLYTLSLYLYFILSSIFYHVDSYSNLKNYYDKEYILAKSATKPNPYANLLIKELKSKGYNLILATNPLFPRIATLNRIKWAGLDENDFTLITTYENSHFCKPNLKYYEEIINKLNLNKDE